jgi:hypothetical protein
MTIPAAVILGIMDLTVAAMRAYPSAQRTYTEWRRELEAMQREGRDPTPADLERFNRRIARNTEILESDDPADPR